MIWGGSSPRRLTQIRIRKNDTHQTGSRSSTGNRYPLTLKKRKDHVTIYCCGSGSSQKKKKWGNLLFITVTEMDPQNCTVPKPYFIHTALSVLLKKIDGNKTLTKTYPSKAQLSFQKNPTYYQWWAKINHLCVKRGFSPYENQRFTSKVIDLCQPLQIIQVPIVVYFWVFIWYHNRYRYTDLALRPLPYPLHCSSTFRHIIELTKYSQLAHAGVLYNHTLRTPLKVHKNENFFGFDFQFYTVSNSNSKSEPN